MHFHSCPRARRVLVGGVVGELRAIWGAVCVLLAEAKKRSRASPFVKRRGLAVRPMRFFESLRRGSLSARGHVCRGHCVGARGYAPGQDLLAPATRPDPC